MQALDRFSRILKAIMEAPDGLTLSEVAASAELPSPTVHRFLKGLSDAGFVERHAASKRYRHGPAITRLALAASAADFIGETEQSGLRALRDRWQECFYFSALIDGDVVCVRSTETTDPVRMGIFVSIGRRLAVHSSAAAKAIMAYQPRQTVEEFLEAAPFDRYTPFTLTQRQELVADLIETRKRGYAVCDQEMEIGVAALALPVFDSRGNVGRSLGVIAPRDRLLLEQQDELLEDMRNTAATLGHALTS
jgi:DNA-binding IclR family transcriptional regulator